VLKYVKGDLFDFKAGIIAHCVNCVGAFGAGVAGQIARLYPGARTAYLMVHERSGWELGMTQLIQVSKEPDLIIANVAGQYDFGTHKVQVDYSALAIGLEKVFKFAELENMSVALPKIGCGLAGGDWGTVERIITTLLMKYPIVVTIYEKGV
jgi:O-acetyl-ADP-ribose deacetylase (regulator of RNase III)